MGGNQFMKYVKPDGVIETGFSGCCCPPGLRHGGMHTNGITTWWKVDGGEWKPSRPAIIRRIALSSNTVKEFKEKIKAEG
jgi:hypothetical protein